MKTLRPHQDRSVDLLRQSLARKKRRPILQLPTGAGKTVIAAAIIRMAREKGKRCLFVVDALSLIDQTVRAFHAEGVQDIGVIQANHPMTDWSKPVQVASVQTLRKRRMPDVELVIVDEAHSKDAWLHEQMASERWENIPFIGLTATPWAKGMGNVYDDLIQPVTMQELIDEGFLAPFRVFAPAHPDLSGVKLVAGEYHEGQLAKVMGDNALVADIVTTWKRLGDNRPTFVFCVNRAHAEKVQARFHEAQIGCGYIDAFTKSDERDEVRRQLDTGQIKVVANVGCLTKGVDWVIGCIVLARPTKSEMLFVQMVGRGLRVNPGMDDCIILDHADNTLRMGFVTDIYRDELCTAKAGEKSKVERKEALPKECPSCSFLKPPKTRECPACGFTAEVRSEIEEGEGNLFELNHAKVKASKEEKQRWFSMLIGYGRAKGYADGWASNKYREKFKVWPQGLDRTPAQPDQEVRNFITSRNIAYARRRAA